MKVNISNTKKLLLGGLLACVSLTSCNDFLTMLPTDQLPEENFWQSKEDLESVRAAAYEKLSQSGLTSKILYWGEFRADNLDLNNASNETISNLQSAVLQPSNGIFDWAAFYTGINYCNLVIEKGADMTEPGKEIDPSYARADYNLTKAEMVALRSLYYFYLVRAYRDVPYVTSSIRTDHEARESYPAVQSGVAILGECIKQCEENLANGPENYGSTSENKGRFTKQGIRALLSDMCLWRACLLHNHLSKVQTRAELSKASKNKDLYSASQSIADIGNVNLDDVLNADSTGYTTVDGEEITQAYCDAEATACLNKSVEYATAVIKEMSDDFAKELKDNPESYRAIPEYQTQKYPLILTAYEGSSIDDNVYNTVIGSGNSRESILELQYDGTTTSNSTITNFYATWSGSAFTTGTMVCSNNLIGSATAETATTGFCRSDLRLLESCYYKSTDARKPFIKFTLKRLYNISNSTNATEPLLNLTDDDENPSWEGDVTTNFNRHWPIYRLTDVMLIKAEALARLNQDLTEGFDLCNEIFKRNNPVAYTNYADKPEFDRLQDGYATGKNAAELLTLVYQERQREFVGEGKRWFDLARQAEWSGDAQSTFEGYFLNGKDLVKNRMNKIWSYYNPIYSEELKVNGVEYGGKLSQNPVWERYETN